MKCKKTFFYTKLSVKGIIILYVVTFFLKNTRLVTE
nr:MAG TPA: hypothetical protein [Caudoviricetes sp.]